MERIFNISIAFTMILLIFILFIIIYLLIMVLDGNPIFWSKRVGKNNKIFLMPKFRTMKLNTPEVASHLLDNPKNSITKIGFLLRKYSLDEIPQLISVLQGRMNIVGPRPSLSNQIDLIELRKERGIDKLLPGITGWAQINGRDKLSIKEKIELDEYYLKNKSFRLDFFIILLTLKKIITKQGISH